MNLLCPGTTTSYIRCPTTAEAIKILEQHTFTNPKTIIIHCGTNDIERIPNKAVSGNIEELIKTIRKEYPSCRIIISSLLPRSDHLLSQVQILNRQLERTISKLSNVLLVRHINLFQSINILIDRKHLNRKGVKLFARNLKGVFFSNKSQTKIGKGIKTARYQHFLTQQIPYHTKPQYHNSHHSMSHPSISPLMQSTHINHNDLSIQSQRHPSINPNDWNTKAASSKPMASNHIPSHVN